MAHNMGGIILKGEYNEVLSKDYDLIGIDLGFKLTLFPISHYYSAYWQAKLNTDGILDLNGIQCSIFPCEKAILQLLKIITKSSHIEFAIIFTDYFGGIGNQYANVYLNYEIANRNIKTINQALSFLGVESNLGLDEFDTVGFSNYRSLPEYLDKYVDLADEIGV